ncbi:PhoH family protein [Ignicoccus hospitalis]|uniref:PhoH family protein n=1 Tax=Ignicoccus hospitalis (strain KIN4/I / DSM 18386 / JCM 14125) TaxID=453591 RepID=A8AAV2_IGNH4|nr:PhoH family protein [Ignicoccus hospitalis]ABU82054.1 PhoH family protein [Ignicoccus hospitalis KIN4/I]HIH91011.1 KH domain-containing protein [Desulfurococcaceae archaeon]
MKKLLGMIEPKTKAQEALVEALMDDKIDVVGAFGPSGTGKSLITIAYAIDSLLNGKYKKFIIARPVIDVVTGKEITAADIGVEDYYRIASAYLIDILSEYVSKEEVRRLYEEDRLMLVDTHYLRGRTFDDAVILLDDAQNAEPEAAVEALMRIGKNSKFIVVGDPVFQTHAEIGKDGASLLREILLNEDTARVIDLGIKDIVRPGARRGIKFMMELRMRKRKLNELEQKVVEAARIYAPDADVITVVEFTEEKRKFGLEENQHVPDALVVLKEGHAPRFIGRGGERIARIEEDSGLRLRTVELTLNLKDIIAAIHPVPWIHKHIVDVDFAGPSLLVKVNEEEFGAFVGQRGSYVRFLSEVMKKLLRVEVWAREVESKKRRRR